MRSAERGETSLPANDLYIVCFDKPVLLAKLFIVILSLNIMYSTISCIDLLFTRHHEL